jgi:RNA polymerase sigma factor (sigma-70 family)
MWQPAGYQTRQPAVRTKALPHDDRRRRFELLALPHLDAAYNLARWLAGNTTDAEDVVQDAYLRAYRYFDAFQGGNFRVWLLTIVRNAFMTWVKENRSGRMMFVPDTPVADNADKEETMWGSRPRDPESLLLESIDSQTLSRLMEQLPAEYREVLLLREVEDLAYKEIAEVTGSPIGTVMSRLSRARLALRKLWLAQADTEDAHGM